MKCYATLALIMWATASNASETMQSYVDWLDENTQLEYNGEPLPTVEYLSQDMLQILHYGDEQVAQAEYHGHQLFDILGLYNQETNVIMVPNGTDIDSSEYAPIMVHELTHFLQSVNGKYEETDCYPSLEPPAYRAQWDWIQAHNHDGEEPNWLWVMLLDMRCRNPHF